MQKVSRGVCVSAIESNRWDGSGGLRRIRAPFTAEDDGVSLGVVGCRWEIGVFLGARGWEGVFATPRLHGVYRENINPPSTFRIRFHVVVMLGSCSAHALLMHEHTPRQDARIRTTTSRREVPVVPYSCPCHAHAIRKPPAPYDRCRGEALGRRPTSPLRRVQKGAVVGVVAAVVVVAAVAVVFGSVT